MTRPSLDLEAAAESVWDVVIIGAGPAGAMAAHQLSALGARTLLVERRAFPREKVCGACLNISALATLESAGLGRAIDALGGIRLEALAVGLSGRSTQFALPGGLALSRARLDAALVDAAVASGTAFLPECQAVVGPIAADTRRVLLGHSGRKVTASARVVLAATGLGQAPFEGEAAVSSFPMPGSRVGAGCTIDGSSESYREGTIFMAVGQGGYVGLVRVEGGRLNVAAAFTKGYLRDHGEPGAAAERILADAGLDSIPSLRDAPWRGTLPLTRRTSPLAGERYFLIGDATGYVEPFTGEGIAWALASGHAIAPLVGQALEGWAPSMPEAWISHHGRSVGRRQRYCRAMATLLRHPRLARAAFELAARAPNVTQFVIRRVNAPFALAQPI